MSYRINLTCRKFSLIGIFLLFLQSGIAQSDFNKVDVWLKDNVQDLGGRAVLVVYKDGKIVYDHAENNLTNKQRAISKFIARRKGINPENIMQDFSSNTRERIASSSKWLSAALVMTFIDEGRLSLDDTIGKFLPVLSAHGKGNIKIWECLSHMTGIKAPTMKESINSMKDIPNMDSAISLIATLPMEGEHGKTFHYSSIGLQIVGAIIEKISGKDFETLFTMRIAEPLGMKNTDFGHGKLAMPAGSAWSTAEEYTRFLTMILNEGVYKGKRILSKNAIIEMQKNRIKPLTNIVYSPAEAGNWGYGLGEWVMDDATENKRSLAITSPGLFGSFPWVDNKNRYSAFLMCFYIKSKGRNERYKELKSLVDDAIKAN